MRPFLRTTVGIVGLLGALATPVSAQRVYERTTGDVTHTLHVDTLENGARASYVLPSCDGIADVAALAQQRGFEAGMDCADGVGAMTLYGDAASAVELLAENASVLLPMSSVVFTPAQVAEQRTAVNAVLDRLRVTTPGTTNPHTTVCHVMGSSGVECSTTIEQHTRAGDTFFNAYCMTNWSVARMPTVGTGAGVQYPDVVALMMNTRSSDMVDGVSACRVDLTLENGATDLHANNYTAAGRGDAKVASWGSLLRTSAGRLMGAHERQLFDAAKETTSIKLCDDINSLNLCYDARIALLRDVAVDTYREDVRSVDGVSGVAVVQRHPSYTPEGQLYQGQIELLVDDAAWTFTKEMSLMMHSPEQSGVVWDFGNGDTTVTYSRGPPYYNGMNWIEMYTRWHPSHVQP